MHLLQVVFYSANQLKPTSGTMRDLVKEILRSCTQYDRVSGLTGALVFNERYFLQAMEGPRAAISQQLRQLAGDNRHSEMVLVSAKPVDRRDFDGWMVGFAGHSDNLDMLYMRYGVSPNFDPTQLTARGAVDLMYDFSRLDGSHFVQRSSPLAAVRDPSRRSDP